ncbi:MAG: DNA translocase FtsK 4TM domain-containing protein, partial [Gammaproteobacteria bacterium]|nr:DNA translocase FtsK 4TM domain-containing protein [Gammaproteobacteria bacterium]
MHASLSKRLKEGGFLLLLAIGAYFLMALFSYSPDDPSWVFESAKQHADNAGGVAGAWAASVLFMLFGKVAYVFPLMIAWGGWLMFRERDDQQHSVYLRIARWIGFVLTVLSATALASLRMGGLDSLPEGPGGITGDLISSSGTAVLNEAGAILLLLTLLLVGITLFAGVSWLAVMDGVGGFLLNVWRQ